MDTPAKRSNAQHLVECLKQLLYEENQKSGNLMQQPMDSCVCGIDTSSESILNRSYLLSIILILFLEDLFLIFNQMFSIRAFGRRDGERSFYLRTQFHMRMQKGDRGSGPLWKITSYMVSIEIFGFPPPPSPPTWKKCDPGLPRSENVGTLWILGKSIVFSVIKPLDPLYKLHPGEPHVEISEGVGYRR